MLLREALSSQDTAFAKLIRSGPLDLSANSVDVEVTVVEAPERRPYRMNRKLTPDEQRELAALYESGASMVDLAKKFECHRNSVLRHLDAAGVKIRPQKLMTPELVAQATVLYAKNHSLAEVGQLLGGLEASTIGKALKRAGITLRPPVADRWHGSPPD